MKCKTRKFKYKIPPIGVLQGIFINANQKHNQMYTMAIEIISLEDFVKLPESFSAPTKCALNNIDNTINFWPYPNKPYEIEIRYYPPLTVF